MSILTVSQLNKIVAFKINSDVKLKSIMIEGEISNFVNHFKSGHLYFSLKDEKSSVKAVMFAQNAKKLKFSPYDGLKVIISASVEVYEQGGIYQLYVSDINPIGQGKSALAFEQLKEKLAQKGFFSQEFKKSIPKFPKKIGVITSADGAALHDVVNILNRRNPLVVLNIYPTLVQGVYADLQICKSLEIADKGGNDLLILARGGGSAEDLSAFNSEKLAEVIFSLETPIISAVGHEIDYTISDFVADKRAATPSEAAEICVIDINSIYKVIDNLVEKLDYLAFEKVNKKLIKIEQCEQKIKANSPQNKMKNHSEKVNILSEKLDLIINSLIKTKENKLISDISLLHSLSPLNIMARGFSLAVKNEKVVKNVSEIEVGDNLKIRLQDGTLDVLVNSKDEGAGV